MGEVIIIVGLPGSGKTYLANARYAPLGHILIDDPVRRPEFDTSFNYVICDPWLCKRPLREKVTKELEQQGFVVKTFFFENNPEKCRKNLVHRNDERNIKSLGIFDYEVPQEKIAIPIWGCS